MGEKFPGDGQVVTQASILRDRIKAETAADEFAIEKLKSWRRRKHAEQSRRSAVQSLFMARA